MFVTLFMYQCLRDFCTVYESTDSWCFRPSLVELWCVYWFKANVWRTRGCLFRRQFITAGEFFSPADVSFVSANDREDNYDGDDDGDADADRVHICRDRWDQRSRKIFVDCVNFSVNNANCEQNLPNPHILRKHLCHFYAKCANIGQIYTYCVNICATFTQSV